MDHKRILFCCHRAHKTTETCFTLLNVHIFSTSFFSSHPLLSCWQILFAFCCYLANLAVCVCLAAMTSFERRSHEHSIISTDSFGEACPQLAFKQERAFPRVFCTRSIRSCLGITREALSAWLRNTFMCYVDTSNDHKPMSYNAKTTTDPTSSRAS